MLLLLTPLLTQRTQRVAPLLQKQNNLPLFGERHCLPAGAFFRILVVVKRHCPKSSFIEAEHG